MKDISEHKLTATQEVEDATTLHTKQDATRVSPVHVMSDEIENIEMEDNLFNTAYTSASVRSWWQSNIRRNVMLISRRINK